MLYEKFYLMALIIELTLENKHSLSNAMLIKWLWNKETSIYVIIIYELYSPINLHFNDRLSVKKFWKIYKKRGCEKHYEKLSYITQYLRKAQNTYQYYINLFTQEPSLRSTFTVLCLAEFCQQICQGMIYLEDKRLIHRFGISLSLAVDSCGFS